MINEWLRLDQGFLWLQVGDKDSSGFKLGIKSTTALKIKVKNQLPRDRTPFGHIKQIMSRGTASLVHVSKLAPP
jgi:hypothetical protein